MSLFFLKKNSYRNNVISVRIGKLVAVSNYLKKSEDGAYTQWKYLCIEGKLKVNFKR